MSHNLVMEDLEEIGTEGMYIEEVLYDYATEGVYMEQVSYNYEIDHNPKPEDEGRIKVYASIQLPETLEFTILKFSLSAKEFSDSLGSYSWEQLNCLEDDERLNFLQVQEARMEIPRLVSNVMLYSVKYPTDCALIYITFLFNPPEEYRRTPQVASATTSEEEEDMMQVSFDESTIDIQFRPASKFAVESLSRRVYEKTKYSSCDDMCPICLDEFKMGERVVTLPCGHEFDDGCVLKWFATNHVCPLCRFELAS
ncbi:unnamed protein product [Arabidopsis lyrata]|uniref:E3 ubiquitin ligase BIG BROTHER n=1 Tax=Arabidopsis lyrata subsp. lyrata TaxID=81972 RepID=UPI000A29DC85|nr:E3 ubiquitin ligase BIG BROTHER [Arabidopsis lyrata subsp. lyrata]CAH8253159.1 unnamed protein product [Arabidopsis lyrata]|eukprot:XP_020870284.1 E3 ubiquitin ligase BIG BROTHER [Arabidopsis lyrata subsp. lyrata]